ncbi:MAG: glucose 1-dehydrogenase [Sandarakinorhabdus sp.]|nr:glucose 1-dehydrogenase [Sandarakinorhabdus sp.]
MATDAGRVAGKVALVTGGARGMGAAHARRLVTEGACVVIGDILDGEGAALAAELGAAARYLHLDVTKPDDWAAAVSLCVTDFGGLHILVNNAGIFGGAAIVDHPLDLWQRIMDINLTGVSLGIRAATAAMIASGGTSIINISSVAGLRGAAGGSAYVASKFGVRGLTKAVAAELAPFGIRCNSVHPGIIDTPMAENLNTQGYDYPLGRMARADEVTNLVLYLASDESSYSTGAEFVVDGGLTMGGISPTRGNG